MNGRSTRVRWTRHDLALPGLELLETRVLLSAIKFGSAPPPKPLHTHDTRSKLHASAPTLQPFVRASSAIVSTGPAPAGAAVAVAGRYVYYGNTPCFGDVQATDKSALLPGNTASWANVTSNVAGINELALDVSNAAASYGAADFTFLAGQSSDPTTWAAAPAPASITVVAGAGSGGSSRVYIRWTNGSLINTWLQVTFKPANDVFYVGNLVGAIGEFQVTSDVQGTVRGNSTSLLSPSSATNTYDFNHDGKVDATDQLIARAAVGDSLTVFAAPALPPPLAYDWHTQTINGVLNIWAPDPSDFGTTFNVTDPTMLFGTAGVPQILAVHQGPISDCYFLAASAALAYSNPSRLENIISTDPTGGWAVTFQYWNNATYTYVPVVVHINHDLSSSFSAVVSDGQLWPLVLEKAFAAFRTWNGTSSLDTMVSLNSGYGGPALQALNDVNTNVYIGSMTNAKLFSTIQTALAAGKPVLYQTSATAPTMVQSHVYVLTGTSTDASGVQWVTTYNPWGFYDTRTISDLAQNGIGSMTVGTN